MNELISIIIPTYNSSKTIKRTLNSIFKQSYKNWEIIVIDAFSNDGTINLIKSYNTNKIKIIFAAKSKGLSFARYLGSKAARGKILAFIDSDDTWNFKKLYFQSRYHKIERKFSCTSHKLKNRNRFKKINCKISKIDYPFLLSNRPIALSTVMVDKKILLQIAKKNLDNIYAEDYLWWLSILKYKIRYCLYFKNYLSSIYLEGNNRSINVIQNYFSLFLIYKKKFELNYLVIFKIFFLLFIRTFSKNIFKFKSLFNEI